MLPTEITVSELTSFADQLIREIVEEELAAAIESDSDERSDETPVPINGFDRGATSVPKRGANRSVDIFQPR
jgi:hypothetical protein